MADWLPPGWEELEHTDGRKYYKDRNTRTTHWEPPVPRPKTGSASATPATRRTKADEIPTWAHTPRQANSPFAAPSTATRAAGTAEVFRLPNKDVKPEQGGRPAAKPNRSVHEQRRDEPDLSFGFPREKSSRLEFETNNTRLAMLGILLGFLKRTSTKYAVVSLPTLFLVVLDYVDFVLDIVLVTQLYSIETTVAKTWGDLLLSGAIISQFVLVLSRLMRESEVSFKEDKIEAKIIFAVYELVVFALEDSTTIMAFTLVDGLFDPSSPTDIANLGVTMFTGIYLLILTFKNVYTEKGRDFADGQTCCLFWPSCSICCMSFVAVYFVLFDGPQRKLEVLCVVVYAFMAVAALLFSFVTGLFAVLDMSGL